MFFSDAILSKRGPLAKVWLASHLERKLTKQQLLQTSIPNSVGAIMNQELVPMALRLSGQLLLGVARIYSRKAKYLLDDCNEALVKIKRAFRPGQVDLTLEQEAAARNTITLQVDDTNPFDMYLHDQHLGVWDDFDLNAVTPNKKNIANQNDITLPSEMDIDLNPADHNTTFDLGFDGSAFGSQEFDLDLGLDTHFDLGLGGADDFELGLDLGGDSAKKRKRNGDGEESDDDVSIELGRKAAMSEDRASRLSVDGFNNFAKDADITMRTEDQTFGDDGGFQPDNMDFDFGGGDFELGLDAPGAATPRAGAPQPEAPVELDADVTPRTAARIAKKSPTKTKRPRLALVDKTIELSQNANRGDSSQTSNPLYANTAAGHAERMKAGLLEKPQYLPASSLEMRYMEIAQNRSAFLLPRQVLSGDRYIAPPPGLPAELAELFTFKQRTPVKKAKTPAPAKSRDPTAEPAPLDFDAFDDGMGQQFDDFVPQGDMGYDGGFENFGDADMTGGDIEVGRKAEHRASSPAVMPWAHDESIADIASPAGTVDKARFASPERLRRATSALASSPAPLVDNEDGDLLTDSQAAAAAGKLQKEAIEFLEYVKKTAAEKTDDQENLTFADVVPQGSKAAVASRAFYHILTLGSKNLIKIKEQPEAYGEIHLALAA